MENDVSACAPSLSSTTTALPGRLSQKFIGNSVRPDPESFSPFTVADLRFVSLLVLTSAILLLTLSQVQTIHIFGYVRSPVLGVKCTKP
jgi:hypothetical protein